MTHAFAKLPVRRALAILLLAGVGGFAGASLWIARAGAEGVPAAPALYYSGTLIESGAPANGVRGVTVALWTAQDGGNKVCSAHDDAVAVVGGRFRLALGDDCVAQVHAQPNLFVEVTFTTATGPTT